MKLKIILGTGRNGRYSDKVAQLLDNQAKSNGIKSSILDVRDYASPFTIPNWQDHELVSKYRKELLGADAFIIVIPEYNHGYPGELKILLDMTKDEYGEKPVYLCGVSSGRFGGARAIENILPILIYLGMRIQLPPLYVPNVQELFNEKGELLDKKFSSRIKKFIERI